MAPDPLRTVSPATALGRLLNEPAFQRLTAEARWVLVVVRAMLESTSWAAGIEVRSARAFPIEVADRTGYTPEVVEIVLQELEHSYADDEARLPWLIREGHIVWLPDLLTTHAEFNAGSWYHCRRVVSHLGTLPTGSPLVQRYRERHAAVIRFGEEPPPRYTGDDQGASPQQPSLAAPPREADRPSATIASSPVATENGTKAPPTTGGRHGTGGEAGEPAAVVQAVLDLPGLAEGTAGNGTDKGKGKGQGGRSRARSTAKAVEAAKPGFQLGPYLDIWADVFDGDHFPTDQGGMWLKKLEAKHGKEKTSLHLRNFCLSHKPPDQRVFAKIGSFYYTFSNWTEVRVLGLAKRGQRPVPPPLAPEQDLLQQNRLQHQRNLSLYEDDFPEEPTGGPER